MADYLGVLGAGGCLVSALVLSKSGCKIWLGLCELLESR
jgi:hypothetical protein